MRATKLVLEMLDLGVGVGVAVVEAAPSAEAATEAEGEIIGLAEVASGFVLRGDLSLERLRGHDAVGFEFGIAGSVVVLIGADLPSLTGQPRQNAALDCREIAAHQ